MAKDPAFLFYPKDWLEGTAEMTPTEKGVYIDLLAHQHQKKTLPADTKRLAKMVGLPESEFLKAWELLKSKFIQMDDRLVNRKLSEITTERSSKSHTNRITGKFATLIRSVKHLPKEDVETLKKSFKLSDFDHLPTELATERLTEWFYSRLPPRSPFRSESIGNANTNAIENENKNKNTIGGAGDKNGTTTLIGQMHEIWINTFPAYTQQKELDYPALRQIADFAFNQAGVVNGYGNLDAEILALNTFQRIADEVKKDPFWVNKPLKSISHNIQEFYNKIKNPVNGTTKSQPPKSTKVDENILKQKLAAKRDEWRQNGS